jgi:hypothetical protein
MATSTVEKDDEIAAPDALEGRNSFGSRLRKSRFLFIGLLVHVLFGIGADRIAGRGPRPLYSKLLPRTGFLNR